MLKTNGGCRFPCLLGIVPGKASWVETYAFLATFADKIEVNNSNYSYWVHFNLSDYYLAEKEKSIGIYVENGIVTGFITGMQLSLSDFLTIYGPPSEIFIRAIGWSTLASVGEFTLVLYYPDKGILAIYDGKVAKGRLLYISPDLITRPDLTYLLLWDPIKNVTFSEAARRSGLVIVPPPSEEDYLPLENATNLNAQSFYQKYKNPQNSGLYFQMEAPDYHKGKP